jgi:hypothetical protein
MTVGWGGRKKALVRVGEKDVFLPTELWSACRPLLLPSLPTFEIRSVAGVAVPAVPHSPHRFPLHLSAYIPVYPFPLVWCATLLFSSARFGEFGVMYMCICEFVQVLYELLELFAL